MSGGKSIHKKKVNVKQVCIWGALVCIVSMSCLLDVAALDWGRTGDIPWQPDSIEGRMIVTYLPHLWKQWPHKYPRGQFLINAVFYKPLIKKWEKASVLPRVSNGENVQSSITQQQMSYLATISRGITVFMSAGILLAVFLTAKKLCRDDLAGVLSSLCLALSCLFMFYSQSGCVDIPAFFWFAWAGCFGLYAIHTDNLLCYLLAGFCASWSICTKEGVATFHVGLAAGLAVLLVHTKLQAGLSLKKAFLSLVNFKVLTAIALAVLVFVTLEGFWGGTQEWHYRRQFWAGVVQNQFRSQEIPFIGLLRQTYNGLFQGWGAPFMILLFLSLIYWVVRYRWQLCLTVFPLLAFFFLTVLVIGQNLERFMMCGYAGIAIMMGKTLADWYRFRKIPRLIRYALPLLVLGPSLLCCIFYNLEMNQDTRVRAEAWMRDNAHRGSIVGLSMRMHYAPRIWLDGFQVIQLWDSRGVDTPKGKVQIRPDYLIGGDQWPCFDSDKEFFGKLFKGQTPYRKRAEFGKIYFKKDSFVWKYCLRFYKLHARISPRILIYEK